MGLKLQGRIPTRSKIRYFIGLPSSLDVSSSMHARPRTTLRVPRWINGCVFYPYRSSTVNIDKLSQFNLETSDAEPFKDYTRLYKSISTSFSPAASSSSSTSVKTAGSPPPLPPPFELQVLLTVPELSPNQVLVVVGNDTSRLRIEPTPRFVLLESWAITFTPDSPDASDLAPATIYKHGIVLFRSIFTLLMVLPAWKLFQRLRRRAGNAALGIMVRVKPPGSQGNDQILDFGMSFPLLMVQVPSLASE